MKGTDNKNTENGGKKEAWIMGPYKEWISLPNVRVKDFITTNVSEKLSGPKDDCKLEKFSNLIAGRSLSTYPAGTGEPICDYFAVEILETRTIVCLADGCGWGPQPREAAVRATEAYMEYLIQTQKTIFDIREAGRSILRAFQKAHMKIIEGYDDVWDAGTTTLCGGIIMELVEDHETLAFLKELGISTQANQTKFSFEQESDSPSLKLKDFTVDSNQTPHTSLPPYKWIFICASVGDCKAFHYSVHTKQITDITAGNRTNLVDPKDPGGRLGPQSENGAADLRNLALYFVPCHADDLIILVSDGVHDNLDPQTLGIPPSDVGMAFDNWVDAEKADALKTDEIKNHFRAQFMRALIKSGGGTFPTLMPENVTGILVDHSTQLTMSSRKFMETYPNKRLPDDYVLYPGKMDHSTCVTLVAGGMTLQNKFGKADSAYGRIPKSNSGVAKENGTKSEDSNKASNHYDAIPKVNGNTNEPATRRLGVFDMDKELLTELSVTPTDTILTLIEAIKEDLEKVIEGRAFRLRKGDDSFSKKPIPIMKKQFTTRVYDFFPLASDIIVMQFGNVPVREPKKGGQSN